MKKLIAIFIMVVTACFVFAGGCNNQNAPEITTYTVTFDSQGGSVVASQEVLAGNPVRRPDTPERDGYYLNGWYTSSSTAADTKWHFDTDRVTKDITLYAGWTVKTSDILVAYFSCTNNTEKIAEYILEVAGGTLYEITPEVPYTSADLNYNTDCRANREQNDPSARPEISGSVENMEQYETVFIGYPIWWGQAPKIIYTFFESYDFSGKTIIPFCTSGSSGIGSSATNLSGLTTGATWKDGRRFSSSATKSQVEDWIASESYIVREEITKMYLTLNGNKIEVTLAENSSVDALVEILKQGDITYTANDYGGFEKVGSLGHTLPTNNSQITTQAGDVILYSGNQIVLFYGSNSWSYTRLGKIYGYSVSELRSLLGAGNGSMQVTLSLS